MQQLRLPAFNLPIRPSVRSAGGSRWSNFSRRTSQYAINLRCPCLSMSMASSGRASEPEQCRQLSSVRNLSTQPIVWPLEPAAPASLSGARGWASVSELTVLWQLPGRLVNGPATRSVTNAYTGADHNSDDDHFTPMLMSRSGLEASASPTGQARRVGSGRVVAAAAASQQLGGSPSRPDSQRGRLHQSDVQHGGRRIGC